MAEAVAGGHEVVFGHFLRDAGHQAVEHRVVGVGKEDGLHVGVGHTHVAHAVLLLVPAGEFVLLDDTVHVVLHGSCHHDSILGPALHGLCINVVHFLFVLHQPSHLLELGEVFRRTLVHTAVIFARVLGKVYLRLDDVIERHGVAFGLGSGFVAAQDIIRAAFHLFHQVLWRPQPHKRFDCCHKR